MGETEKYDNENIDYFVSEIGNNSADIIILQEVHISENQNQAEYIANKLGFGYCESFILSESHLKKGESLGLAIISKFPIVSVKKHLLSNPKLEKEYHGGIITSHDKGLLEIIVQKGKTDISIFSGHLLPFHIFGKNIMDNEFAYIREEVQTIIQQTNNPVIVGIDINYDASIQDFFPSMIKNGYISVLEDKITRPTGGKSDRILCSKHFIGKTGGVYSGKSDHFCLSCDIIFSK